jgi:glycosyltransferase involved in cell wall biosynthesis
MTMETSPPPSPLISVPLISVIVPVKDEEDAILPFVARVSAILNMLREADGSIAAWEIIFIDDGSSDATLAAILIANAARGSRYRAISARKRRFRPGSTMPAAGR